MTSIFVFVLGAALLIFSAEKLIHHLVGVASGLKISLFLLAVVFTGIEFDDIFLGVVLNFEDLGQVALGIVLGTAISMIGIVLAIAAILTPGKISIPRDYVAMFALAPLVLVPFALMSSLTAVDGVILLGLFVLFVSYVAVRESGSDAPVFRDAELHEAYVAALESRRSTTALVDPTPPRAIGPHGGRTPSGGGTRRPPSASSHFAEAHRRSGWAGLGLALLALVGLIVGASATGIGIGGILEDHSIQNTLFGATIATLVLTVEDIFLTVEPARKGAPEIGIGNVIGSVVFSLTAKLGTILLAGGLVIGPNVLTWHLPALVVLTGIAAYFLFTGRLRQWHGYLLLCCYIIYWIVSFVEFGAAPIDVS